MLLKFPAYQYSKARTSVDAYPRKPGHPRHVEQYHPDFAFFLRCVIPGPSLAAPRSVCFT
jgi:hypothetical protein